LQQNALVVFRLATIWARCSRFSRRVTPFVVLGVQELLRMTLATRRGDAVVTRSTTTNPGIGCAPQEKMRYSKLFRNRAAGPLCLLASLAAACSTDDAGNADDGAAGAGSGAVSGSGGSSGSGAGSGGSSASGGTGGSSVAGSGGSESGGSSGTAGASSGTSGAPPAQLFGTVAVNVEPTTEEDDGYTTILGRFLDGPTPPPVPLELDSEAGDCELLVPSRPFCESCAPPAVCTADEVCTEYPSPVTVGTLTIEGLGPETLTIEPAANAYQTPALTNPPCEPGTPIVASTSDFELSATCIPELEVTSTEPVSVMSGESVSVTWVAPESDIDSRVVIVLDVAHHGGKTGEVRCEVPDTGSFEIPASLVTSLVSLGLAGYPTIDVTRVSTGTDPTGREVNLVVSSHALLDADTGVTSCREDTDCPDGQTCQGTLICG
jgi:hypothetical protein